MAQRTDQIAWNAAFKAKHGCHYTTLYRRTHPKAAQRHREAQAARYAAGYRYAPTVESAERAKARSEKYRRDVKQACYAAYGGAHCACCGETEMAFLSIDHTNNDGAIDRKRMPSGARTGGVGLYNWLRKRNYPPGYQVLCMNCNFGKQRNAGICPHMRTIT